MIQITYLVLAIVLLIGLSSFAPKETLDFVRFGKLTVYRNSPQPANVVLFVSGDGGWNLGGIDMARSLAGLLIVITLQCSSVTLPERPWSTRLAAQASPNTFCGAISRDSVLIYR